MPDTITLRTSIPKQTQLASVNRGAILALFGIIWIIAFATFSPLAFLNNWGLPLILIGLGAITMGYLPYRKLTLLATHPDKLIIDKEGVTFEQRGKPQLWIPLSAISSVWHQESPPAMACTISNDQEHPIKVLNPHFSLKRNRQKAKESGNADLLFYYFSETACQELEAIIAQPE